jgi:hypothetical protein
MSDARLAPLPISTVPTSQRGTRSITILQESVHQATQQQKPKHELDRLLLNFASDLQINDDLIGILETKYLTSRAEKRLIPVPQGSLPLDERGNDRWRTAKDSAILYLNDDGIRELHVAIRLIAENALSLPAHGSRAHWTDQNRVAKHDTKENYIPHILWHRQRQCLINSFMVNLF